MFEPEEINEALVAAVEANILHKLTSEFPGAAIRNIDASEATKLAKRNRMLELTKNAADPLTEHDRWNLTKRLINAVFDPLDALLADSSVEAISITSPESTIIFQHGRWAACDLKFSNDQELRQSIARLIHPLKLDEKQPLVSTQLLDGSHLEAAIAPVAMGSPFLCIQKTQTNRMTLEQMANARPDYPTMSDDMAKVLQACVHGKVNIIIAGDYKSGKTTLLNALAETLPRKESFNWPDRLVYIEKYPELSHNSNYHVNMSLPPVDWKGESGVTMRMLVRKAMRLEGSRIILGDCDGAEANDLLYAMANSHKGAMTCVNAVTVTDCLQQLEHMVLLSDQNIRPAMARFLIARAVPVVAIIKRFEDGTRKISEIAQVEGLDGDEFKCSTLFHVERAGRSPRGFFKVNFIAHGKPPRFLEQLEQECVPFKLEWLGCGRPGAATPAV